MRGRERARERERKKRQAARVESEREGESKRKQETDRQTDRQTDRHTERQLIVILSEDPSILYIAWMGVKNFGFTEKQKNIEQGSTKLKELHVCIMRVQKKMAA